MWLSDSGSIKTPSTYRGAKEKLWRSHFFPSSRLILHNKQQKTTAVCLFIHPYFYLSVVNKCIAFSMHIILNTEKQGPKKDDKRFKVVSFATVEKWSTLHSFQGEKLPWHQAEQQNKCSSAQVNFWRWQNNSKERYDSGCNIRNRFGAVSNHLSQSLITFDRAVLSRDIKVDSVTKLPHHGPLMRAFLVSYFHPAPLFIYIKALKPSYPTTSTKL